MDFALGVRTNELMDGRCGYVCVQRTTKYNANSSTDSEMSRNFIEREMKEMSRERAHTTQNSHIRFYFIFPFLLFVLYDFIVDSTTAKLFISQEI